MKTFQPTCFGVLQTQMTYMNSIGSLENQSFSVVSITIKNSSNYIKVDCFCIKNKKEIIAKHNKNF
jgi:hypothetical protein